MIDSLTIQKLVVETYGKRPIARPFIAQVYANAIKDGQALLVNAGSFDVNFTPAAPFIDTGYYLVGDMFTIKNDKDETSVNGWSADGMVGFSHSGTDVYEDSKFSIVFTTTADNQCWKIIPKTNTEGEFWGWCIGNRNRWRYRYRRNTYNKQSTSRHDNPSRHV